MSGRKGASREDPCSCKLVREARRAAEGRTADMGREKRSLYNAGLCPRLFGLIRSERSPTSPALRTTHAAVFGARSAQKAD